MISGMNQSPDIMNGFVVRNNDGNIIEIYTKEEQGM